MCASYSSGPKSASDPFPLTYLRRPDTLPIMVRTYLCLLLVAGVLVGCSSDPVQPPAFQAERSFQSLLRQVSFGPRVPGTEASAACRDYFYDHFRSCGLEVDSQAFSFFDPYSETEKPLVNVIARYRGGDKGELPILLMAHYDSRPRTDFHSDTTRRDEPIVGANDGGSGVAVLIELASLLAKQPSDCNLDIVLVDGEDWGRPRDFELYLLGSSEFARGGIGHKYRFGIVVDMVGDRYQQIYREQYTEKFFKPVNDMIWKVAADLGVTTFKDAVRHTIRDDHLPLGAAGVPTALLIDFDYKYWHTENDTPDKCSAESLGNVGRVLAYIIYNKAIWPEK